MSESEIRELVAEVYDKNERETAVNLGHYKQYDAWTAFANGKSAIGDTQEEALRALLDRLP